MLGFSHLLQGIDDDEANIGVSMDETDDLFFQSLPNSVTFRLQNEPFRVFFCIDKLVKAGVTSLKIEGRAKSAYYVSVITNAYRMAVDWYKEHPDDYKLPDYIRDEVFKVSHRDYCTGFFFGHPSECRDRKSVV